MAEKYLIETGNIFAVIVKFAAKPTKTQMIMVRNRECECAKQTPYAQVRRFAAQENGVLHVAEHGVVFVIEGEGKTSDDHTSIEITLTKGEFVFVPLGIRASYHATQNSTLLLLSLVEPVAECNIFRMNKDFKDIDVLKPHTLRWDDHIKHFTQSLTLAIDGGMVCKHYMSAKVAEFVYLLHAYYAEDECVRFFAPVVSADVVFSEFVRQNHHKFKTVRDIALAMNMSPHNFSLKFKKVFGERPAINASKIDNYYLAGQIIIVGEKINITKNARLHDVIIIANNITVEDGFRGSAQLFARDSVVVENGAKLGKPSEIYSQKYAEFNGELEGYLIVKNDEKEDIMTPALRMSEDVKISGLLYCDGISELRGEVKGCAILSKSVYYTPQGYYADFLYDFKAKASEVIYPILPDAPPERRGAKWVR